MSVSSDDFQQLVEASPSLFALLDDISIRYINTSGMHLLGVTDGSTLIGHSILDYIFPDDQRAFLNTLLQVETQTVDMPVYVESRVRHAARRDIRWCGFHLRLITIDGQKLTYVNGQDISSYAILNQRLQTFEQQFIAVFRQSPNGILLINPISGLVMRGNPAAGEILGENRERLLGKHFDVLFPPANPESSFRNLVQTQQALSESRLYQQADGTIMPLVITLSHTFWNEQGAVVIAILHDISARMSAETERREREVIQRAYEKEREVYEMKYRFMSIVSHEFRTPLATIQTSTELLENYYERMAPERRAAGFMTIKDQIRYLTDMLEDISVVIKTESGRLFFEPVLLNVVDFCQALADEVRHDTRTAHQIHIQTIGNFPDMPMDPVLLRYILRNLLTNAIKYSPDSTDVLLELARPTTGKIFFRVIDSGIGIPTADQDMLFLAYERASNAGTIRGSGMGLQIAKEAAHLHGGDIWFTSEEGKGTTFVVSLPDPLAKAPVE